MKNTNLILKLIDNSTDAFGQLLGITEEEKLKKTLYITQSTMVETFNLDLRTLSKKRFAGILSKNTFNMEQAQQLTNLLWLQAELLFKLNKKGESLMYYKNTLAVLHWKIKQSTDREIFERKNKVIELESIIEDFKTSKILNHNY